MNRRKKNQKKEKQSPQSYTPSNQYNKFDALVNESRHNPNIYHLNIDYILSEFACDVIVYMKFKLHIHKIKIKRNKKQLKYLMQSRLNC